MIRTPKKDVTDARATRCSRAGRRIGCEAKMYDDEKGFYLAVEEYIRNGYKMLERISDGAQQRAAGFLLTTFQKLNASSTAAIKAALQGRLMRLQGEICDLPKTTRTRTAMSDLKVNWKSGSPQERPRNHGGRDRSAGTATGRAGKRDKKLTELLGLTDQIAKESARGDQEKVLIFTEYRQTQRYLVEVLEGDKGSFLDSPLGIKESLPMPFHRAGPGSSRRRGGSCCQRRADRSTSRFVSAAPHPRWRFAQRPGA